MHVMQTLVELERRSSYTIGEDGADSLPAYMYIICTHNISSKQCIRYYIMVDTGLYLPFITNKDLGVVAVLLNGYPSCSSTNADTL